MASSNPGRPLQTGSDEFALAMEVHKPGMMRTQRIKRVFWDQGTNRMYETQNHTSGVSMQFEWVADTPRPERHRGGQDRLGQTYNFYDQNITLDYPLTSHHEITKYDQIVSHYDIKGPLLMQIVSKLSEEMDSIMAISTALAARTAAVSKNGYEVHSGGNRVTRNAASVAAAYPRSATGARQFHDDLRELARKQDEDDLPEDDRFCVVTPYMRDVLQYDPLIFDKDLSSYPSDLATRTLGKVAGYWILVSNNMPSTDTSNPANTASYQDNPKYQDDFTTAGGSTKGQPVALALTGASVGMAAVGLLEAEPLMINAGWEDNRKRTIFIDGVMTNGVGTLNPEAAGEIAVYA